MLASDLELTTARLKVYFLALTICLPKLFMASLYLWTKNNTGEPSSAKNGTGAYRGAYFA